MFQENASVPEMEISTAADIPMTQKDHLDAEEKDSVEEITRLRADAVDHHADSIVGQWKALLYGEHGWKFGEKFQVRHSIQTDEATGERSVRPYLQAIDAFSGFVKTTSPQSLQIGARLVKDGSEEYDEIEKVAKAAAEFADTLEYSSMFGPTARVKVIKLFKDLATAQAIMAATNEYELNSWASRNSRADQTENFQQKEGRSGDMVRKAFVADQVFNTLLKKAEMDGVQYLPNRDTNWDYEVNNNLRQKASFAQREIEDTLKKTADLANGVAPVHSRVSLFASAKGVAPDADEAEDAVAAV